MASDAPTRLLISIQPRHTKQILSGKKRVELRRVRPAVGAGDEIIVYETFPTCAVVCRALVREVIADAPNRLWRLVGSTSGIDRSEFLDYFDGCDAGFAIRIVEVRVLESPVSLRTLRRAVPGFAPPQSYHYLKTNRPRDRRLAACL
jgi:predicted transcriptional regulator